jgi:DNA-binding transcriptional MocR family regulator
VIRSLSKVLGPDLRVALIAGDPLTISRVEGRQLLGAGWISHLLQQTAANLWAAAGTPELLARAERTYRQRRQALVQALDRFEITAYGDTGLGVWVPLAEEAETVQQLLERGWAVSAGERFRFRAQPGMRITTTTLDPQDARALASAINDVVNGAMSTYAG